MSISTNYHQLRIQCVWIYIYIHIKNTILNSSKHYMYDYICMHASFQSWSKLESPWGSQSRTEKVAWTCNRTTNPRPRAYRERFFWHSWRLQPKRPPGGAIFSPFYMDDPNSPNCVGWDFSPRLSQAGSAVGCSQNKSRQLHNWSLKPILTLMLDIKTNLSI